MIVSYTLQQTPDYADSISMTEGDGTPIRVKIFNNGWSYDQEQIK